MTTDKQDKTPIKHQCKWPLLSYPAKRWCFTGGFTGGPLASQFYMLPESFVEKQLKDQFTEAYFDRLHIIFLKRLTLLSASCSRMAFTFYSCFTCPEKLRVVVIFLQLYWSGHISLF